MATDTMQPMPVIFQRTPTEASARTPNTKDTIAAKIALLIHLRSFAKLKYFLSNLLAANSILCCLRTASPQGIDAQASEGSAAPLTERSDETCSVEQFSSADREYSSAGRTTLDREYRSAPFRS